MNAINKSRPLWSLAKRSLSERENRWEMLAFLRQNKRNYEGSPRVNMENLLARLSLLLLFIQVPYLTESIWMILFFFTKSLLLFNINLKKKHTSHLLMVMLSFPVLSMMVSNLPIAPYIKWVSLIWFVLFDMGEKYLSLHLLVNELGVANNLLLLMLLMVGNRRIQVPFLRLLIGADLLVLGLNEEWTLALGFLALMFVVKVIENLDTRMRKTKKRYHHLYEVPSIPEYH